MTRAKESLRIAVTQSTEEDERVVTLTLTALAKDFLLPDLLSDQGAIDPYARKEIRRNAGANDGGAA